MSWKLQTLLWKFLPESRAVNLSLIVFSCLIVLCVVAFTISRVFKQRWLSCASVVCAVLILFFWGGLFLSRPAWLRIATQPTVPTPTASALQWTARTSGFETADLTLQVNGVDVDHMVLVRLDPHLYSLSVHWDPTGSRTAEDWQREFGAAVVVNGSYFDQQFLPLTPLRTSGISAGPTHYESTHGAFVADGNEVKILDLHHRDVFQAITPFPDAMVSYPLLLDANGVNRAIESTGWLASRNFIALDVDGCVVLGTTETGFFTLHRLGEFLKDGPLNLRVALNLDGGPLVSQIIRVGGFTRNVHGTAEISNGADVLRVFWHRHFASNWTLPIVLIARPISECRREKCESENAIFAQKRG